MANGFCGSKLNILPIVTFKDKIFFEDTPIVYIHPPKTGGGNIVYLIKALKNEFNITFISSRTRCPEDIFKTYDIMSQDCLGGITNFQQHPDLFNLKDNDFIKIITGLFPLPENDYFKVDTNTIVTVRHPLDRLLSLANYLYQENYIQVSDVEKLLLEIEADNLQTRLLAGESYMNGECTQETLATAKRNIDEKFKLTVPTEEIELLMSIFAAYFNIENIAWAKANITGVNIVSKKDLELCNKILARNNYDIELYEYVLQHWNEWKNKHIETISANMSEEKEYMVLSSDFYNHNKIHYMNLDLVLHYGEDSPELISGKQLWWN